jgi:hypothetical protein
MAERTRKDRMREATSLVVFTLLAVYGAWQFITTSLTYSSTVRWVATDNIAYYTWGFIPGIVMPLPVLYAWYIWRVFPRVRASAPVMRIRDRPGTAFAIGLAVGSMTWSLGLTAILVITGTQVPWPLAYGNGFIAGLVVCAAIVYVLFLAYPYARSAAASQS